MNNTSCNNRLMDMPDRPLEGEEKELVQDMLESIARPDAVIENIVVGSKFLGIIADGRMGLSSLLGAAPKGDEKDLENRLIGKTLKEAAELLKSPSPFCISLGFAALNAGCTPNPETVEPSNFPADDLIASLGKGKMTGLVGEFPFVESLKTRVGTLHLFELRDVPGAVPRDQWEAVLLKLDVLAVTGTALLTRSMAWFLSRCRPQTKIVVLGPTTPLSETLFKNGADYLCGSVVTDIKKVSKSLQEGLPFKRVKHKGGIIFTQWEKTALQK